jgi:hypothetical protein
MSVKVKIYIPTAKILKARGLGSDAGARKYLASEVKRFCEPYVPMQQGNLARDAVIAADGSSLTYQGPYAHYQYEGKVYGPNYTNGEIFWSGKAPKTPTGEKLTYHGAPMRGPQWDKRMMADKSKDLERSIEAYIKKRG